MHPTVAELLRRVDASFAERGWPDDVHDHLVDRGLVPAVAAFAEVDREETVPMDLAVAAVAGVVAGMLALEQQDDARHRRRLNAARRGHRPAAATDALSPRDLLRVLGRTARRRLWKRGRA